YYSQGGIDTLSELTDIPVEKLDKQEITRCNLVLQKHLDNLIKYYSEEGVEKLEKEPAKKKE
ncbi:MAG: hypothetical protein EZS28_016178, partial [Streblomastix strix]